MKKIIFGTIIGILIGILIGNMLLRGKIIFTAPKEIKNSELIFSSSGPCEEVSGFWISNGYCSNRNINGDLGVIVIHPVSISVGRFITKELLLPTNATKLTIKVMDANDYFSNTKCPDCDVGFEIYITDLTDWSEHKLDDFIVSVSEGWVTRSYDISQFAGKKIILNIYSYAGGKDLWNGEWATVGYIEIL